MDGLSQRGQDLAVLVVAYLRPDNLRRILEISQSAGVTKFFISVDFPRNASMDDLKLNAKVLSISRNFKSVSGCEVHIFERKENVGCSAAVLSSCDWFFEHINYGIILEDDCLPTVDFFAYCSDAFPLIEDNQDVWLACGTQFAPPLSSDSWVLSRYALTWGWATTKNKWNQISSSLNEPFTGLKASMERDISISESVYWNAGALRAIRGISDAWDTPLVQKMLLKSKLAVLPRVALVSNIGNDSQATHTHGTSIGLRLKTGSHSPTSRKPNSVKEIDAWLREYFYQISTRHVVSTKITRLVDFFSCQVLKSISLAKRWERARIEL
jgi:hypothetical protein